MVLETLDGAGRARVKFDFNIEDYRMLMCDFLELGYRSVRLPQLNPAERHLFVRHDVDICMERATRIAEAESDIGIQATYYILISTDVYNPAAAINRRRMTEIVRLGHSIGLHFDATQYSGDRQALERAAAEECVILESLASTAVESISFHRPATELFGIEGLFANRPHTYDPRIMQEVGYVSDSSGGFYQGHPLDHPAILQGRAMQVLTHPIWWAGQKTTTPAEHLSQVKGEHDARLDSILQATTAKARTRGV